MIVVDTSVVACLYLPTERTAHAEALLERDPEWAAPLLWRSEFRNVLAGYMQRKTLTLDEAKSLQAEAEALLADNEFELASARVLELVRDSDCSTHDCEFVALAAHLRVKLVTLDSRLIRAFPRHAVSLTAA